MRSFAEACERVAATRKKTEKIRILAELFRASPREDAALAAVFLGGRAFPAKEETTLDVGGALLGRAVIAASGADEAALSAAYRRHGDLGAAAYDLFALAGHEGEDRSLAQVEAGLRAIAAARGQAAKLAALGDLFAGAGPLEVKYLVKIITGELRIGLKESLVEEAIAAAFAAPLAAVQRAGMLLGDAGEVLALAADEALDRAKMRLFHAVAPMLATPAESAVSAFEAFPDARVEDKYDGIRAQVHVKGGVARMFSRTLDEVTESFPDLVPELARFAGEAILDGEIVAYREGRALSFAELQKRLGRKKPPKALQREVPVAFIAFDLLYAEGELFLEKPLAERHARLDLLFASRRPTAAPAHGQLALFATEAAPAGAVLRAPVHAATSAASLEALFDEARARGNEGLMIKDAASPYTPGRRGQAWLKLKRELGTLDVVVTAVEYGHGRRAGVLSDYTFAVRDGERLLTIGKAYSGLTDAEIAELTPWFVAHTIEDHGHLRVVEPLLVIEVAFNNMMETRRHSSGLALRFPRIVRVRRDKRVDDIDTLETARALFARQNVTPDPEPS